MTAFELSISIYSGRCKCCLADNGLQNMWEDNGEYEVFGKLLQECFQLNWDIKDTEYICEACIKRLKDAVNFKKEFLSIQEFLQEVAEKSSIVIKLPDDTVNQSVPAEEQEDFTEIEYLDVGEDTDEHLPEQYDLSEHQKRRRRGIYKRYTTDELKAAKQAVEGGMSILAAAEKYGIPRKTLAAKINAAEEARDEDKDANQEKYIKFIEEIRTILTHTNAIPFKSKTLRYYCAYCSTDGEFFEDDEKLRAHTIGVHENERIRNVEEFMRPPWLNEVLKLDIKDLQCITCSVSIPDWNSLFVHFAVAHDYEFNEAYSRIIPYCLAQDLKCVLCLEECHNFGKLDGHMNSHFCNYICYECGDTFLAASRLDKHLKVHKVGKYPCSICKKMFTLELYRTKHINLVHKQESSVKCLYCAEKFVGTFQRHLHVTQNHPDKVRVLTCEYCGKSFTWKPYFIAHKRRQHKNDKKHECQQCGKKFLMNYELRNHMISHTGDKDFICGICGKGFKRLLYLKQHWKQHDEFYNVI